MTRGTLIVLVKAPKAGRVKTRLGRDIGYGRAAQLFRILTEMTVSEALKSGMEVALAVDPRGDMGAWKHLWPPAVRRMPQVRGGLGVRLIAAMEAAKKGPVAVIGADASGFRARHAREAFAALGAHDAAFGPASDGGFWLVGLARRRHAPDFFKGVRWSTKHALKDAVKSLPKSFRVARLDTLADIDEAEDLRAPILRSPARVRAE